MNLGSGLTLADGSGTLLSGAVLDFNLNTPMSGDLVSTTSLYLGTDGVLNFNGSLAVNQDYPLIDFTGSPLSGDNSPTWRVGTHAGDSGHNYSFLISNGTGLGGSNVFELVVTAAIGNGSGTWISNSDGRYGYGNNWSSGLVPDNSGGNYYTATFGGTSTSPPNGQASNILLENSGSQATNFTVGGLVFTSASVNYTIGSDGNGSLTLDNGGIGGGPSVVVGSGVAGPTIFASLILGDTVTKSTTLNVAGGTYLDISGPISESASYTGQSITLTGGGTLYLDATNSYTGSTTVNGGSALYVGFNGTPSTLGAGTSPLAINDSGSSGESVQLNQHRQPFGNRRRGAVGRGLGDNADGEPEQFHDVCRHDLDRRRQQPDGGEQQQQHIDDQRRADVGQRQLDDGQFRHARADKQLAGKCNRQRVDHGRDPRGDIAIGRLGLGAHQRRGHHQSWFVRFQRRTAGHERQSDGRRDHRHRHAQRWRDHLRRRHRSKRRRQPHRHADSAKQPHDQRRLDGDNRPIRSAGWRRGTGRGKCSRRHERRRNERRGIGRRKRSIHRDSTGYRGRRDQQHDRSSARKPHRRNRAAGGNRSRLGCELAGEPRACRAAGERIRRGGFLVGHRRRFEPTRIGLQRA